MAEAIQEEPQLNGTPTPTADTSHQRVDSGIKQRRPSVDKDAQDMVIESLRTQIQDLISQVSQLNNKLVKSYDRVSDLEDDLHVASANVRTSSLKISQLELERTQHLSALNTGLLVEKTHVTAELNRLMEKATEEAAQRGQAESARIAIEKDLDDLSATLFGQANTMVAEARFEKHLSERKVEDAERALKSAEEAVQVMQSQMQTMQAEREDAEKKTHDMELIMGKGKWAKRRDSDITVSLRLLSTHSPYQDYLAFLAHLRVLHPTSPNPPAMSTLLQLPLLSRLMTEDSEPTVRLDLAPSLNWLSRRSVLTAIHSGQLTIEPVSAVSLFAESATYPAPTTIAGINSSNDNISCALCGTSIFPAPDSSHPSRPPVHPRGSWSGALFKKTGSIGYGVGNTQPSSPTLSSHRASISSQHLNSQIFIFRLASLPSSTIVSLPLPSLTKSSSQPTSSPAPSSYGYASTSNNGAVVHYSQSSSGSPNNQPTTIYPLCMSGWCLNRLRTTCTLWAFVRTGIVEKVWEEELPPPPPPPENIHVEKSSSAGGSGEKPPIPPRKRGLWGIASALGERAASWSEGDREKSKKAMALPPPPSHPASVAHGQPPHEPRKLPPPLPPVNAARSVSHPPPPVPKRNEGRSRTPASANSPPTTNGTSTPTEPAPAPVPTPRTSSDLPPVPISPIRAAHLPYLASSQGGPPPIPPRAHTPSNVPLPVSRPTTPAVPPRAMSPAVPVAAAVAPPPIPRRAAARARIAGPGSRPVTPANADVAAGSEKPAAEPTPANSEAKVDEEEKKEKVEETEAKVHANEQDERANDKVDVDAAAASSSEESNKAEMSEGSAEKKLDMDAAVVDRTSQPSPASEVFVDALSPGQEIDEPVVDSVQQQQDSPNVEEKLKVEVKVEEQGELDKDKDVVIDSPVAESDMALPASAEPVTTSANDEQKEGDVPGKLAVNGHESEGEYVHVNGVDEKDEKETKADVKLKLEEETQRREKEEKDKAGFVGDATWEERTWKELVRLREDMFWARIGGFRE